MELLALPGRRTAESFDPDIQSAARKDLKAYLQPFIHDVTSSDTFLAPALEFVTKEMGIDGDVCRDDGGTED
jgi:hypothetical protein